MHPIEESSDGIGPGSVGLQDIDHFRRPSDGVGAEIVIENTQSGYADNLLQQFLVGAGLFLCTFVFGNIEDRSNRAQGPAFGPLTLEKGLRPQIDPPNGSVRHEQASFERVATVSARVVAEADRVHNPIAIFGMHAFDEDGDTYRFGEAHAQDSPHSWRPFNDIDAMVVIEDTQPDHANDLLQQILAGAQLFLRQLAFGDVHQRAHRACRSASRTFAHEECLRPQAHPSYGPIRPSDACLVGVQAITTRVVATPDRRGDSLAVLGVHPLKEFRDGRPLTDTQSKHVPQFRRPLNGFGMVVVVKNSQPGQTNGLLQQLTRWCAATLRPPCAR